MPPQLWVKYRPGYRSVYRARFSRGDLDVVVFNNVFSRNKDIDSRHYQVFVWIPEINFEIHEGTLNGYFDKEGLADLYFQHQFDVTHNEWREHINRDAGYVYVVDTNHSWLEHYKKNEVNVIDYGTRLYNGIIQIYDKYGKFDLQSPYIRASSRLKRIRNIASSPSSDKVKLLISMGEIESLVGKVLDDFDDYPNEVVW